MFDKNIDAEKEKAFNEFTKEYGQRKEDWIIYDDDWHDWDDFFCEIKTHWNTKAVKYWKEKMLPELQGLWDLKPKKQHLSYHNLVLIKKGLYDSKRHWHQSKLGKQNP